MKTSLKQILALSAFLGLPLVTLSGCGLKVDLGKIFSSASVVGNGKLTTETREIKPFDRIEVQGAIHVEFDQSDDSSLEITADENILPIINTSSDGDTLKLSSDSSYSTSNSVTVKVKAKSLQKYVGSGATHGKVKDLETNSLEVVLSGASSLECSGKGAESLTAQISGASSLKATSLQVKSAQLKVSGASKAHVNAENSLDVNASGASTVKYDGQPNLHEVVSGASSVKQASK